MDKCSQRILSESSKREAFWNRNSKGCILKIANGLKFELEMKKRSSKVSSRVFIFGSDRRV